MLSNKHTDNKEQFAKWIALSATVPRNKRKGLDNVTVDAYIEELSRGSNSSTYSFNAHFSGAILEQGKAEQATYSHEYEQEHSDRETGEAYIKGQLKEIGKLVKGFNSTLTPCLQGCSLTVPSYFSRLHRQ
ncbi:MAG: hypothetical protein ACP5D2_03220 [Candidatus Nanoarchaeia archaeon]